MKYFSLVSFYLWVVLLAACDLAGDHHEVPNKTIGFTTAAPTVPDSAPVPLGKVEGEVGEKAPFMVKGNTVYVNNRICAFSGTWMREDTLDSFISTVTYDGPDPRFAGKTLIFNQCCSGCIGAFPAKWVAERDRIMHFHGLT